MTQTCRYRTGVSALTCSFCRLFFLQALPFEFAGLCRVRSLSCLSRARASSLLAGSPPFAGFLPFTAFCLAGFCFSRASRWAPCPSRAFTPSWAPCPSCPSWAFGPPFAGFLPFAGSQVSFERFGPCSEILRSLSSVLLFVLKILNSFVFERLAPCSQHFTTFSQICSVFCPFERCASLSQSLKSLSSGLLLVLKLTVPFEIL